MGLLGVYCELNPDSKADQHNQRMNGMDPLVSKLRQINLHTSGITARISAERLLDEHDKKICGFDQRTLGYEDRMNVEGRSGELGLSLLLLMSGAGASIDCIAATGALGSSGDPMDTAVDPVASVPGKLRAVLDERHKEDGKISRLRYFFTAVQYLDADGLHKSVADLPIVQDLKRSGIEVVPVRTLGEAAKELGVFRKLRLRRVLKRWLLALACGAAVTAVAIGVAAYWWLYHEVGMEFNKRSEDLGAKPYIVCSGPNGTVSDFRPLRHRGPKPLVPAGSEIGWSVTVGGDSPNERWLYEELHRWTGYAGYHVAAVLVNDRGPPVQFYGPTHGDSNEVIRIGPGRVWHHAVALDGQAGESVLVLMASPSGLDGDGLQQELEERFHFRSAKERDLPGVVDYLRTRASVLTYPYASVLEPSPCTG